MRTATAEVPVSGPVPPTFLLVDDSRFDRLLLRTAFQRGVHDANLVEVATLEDARRFLDQADADLIIVDNGMPDGNGVDFVRGIAADPRLSRIPVVMISGGDCAALAPKAAEAGCTTVVSKSQISPATISDLIAEFLARRTEQSAAPETARDQDGEARVVVEFSRTLSQKFAAPLSRALRLVRTARTEAANGNRDTVLEQHDELEKAIFAARDFIKEV